MAVNSYQWLLFALLALEASLGIVSLLAQSDVFYPSPLAWAIVEFATFALVLLLWVVFTYFWQPGTKKRGGVLIRTFSVYFALAGAAHFTLAVQWAIYLARSLGLSPLDWINNPNAFSVFRSLFLQQLIFSVLLLGFVLLDYRHCELWHAVRRMNSRRKLDDN